MSDPNGNRRRWGGRADEPAMLQLARVVRPYGWKLLGALGALIALTAVNILVPQLIGMLFDDVFPSAGETLTDPNWGLLWLILLGILVLSVARNIFYFHSKYTAVKVGENTSFELRKRLFDVLQQMNLQYYRENKPGRLSSRVMNDSFVVQQFIQDDLPKLLQALLLFLGILATIYAMNWQLALASTVVLPLHLLTFWYFKRPIKRASKTAQEHMAVATGNLIEKFLGIEVVKGFTAEKRENQAFAEAIEQSRRSQLESQKYHVGQKVAADLLIGVGMISLIGFGAYQVMGRPEGQRMQPGDFLTFFWYVKMLYPTVLDLMSGFAKLTKASGGVDRVFEVLHTPGQERTAGGDKPAIHGAVSFEGVGLRYAVGPEVLKGLSFRVEPGQVCAIIGPSGAGKSTLMNLVPRFLEAQRGSVKLDGCDVRKMDLGHLRRSIGFAFQECFLFSASILENLRYAQPEASRERIVDVAKRAGAHDFIQKLPRQYDTVVGEGGISLSRGEKQLITLTRAMLKDPKVLILDEATASIDPAKESQIIPEILSFMKGKTTLMVTHRPELIRHADVVLRLEDGGVGYFGPPGDEGASAEPEPRREAPSSTRPRRVRGREDSGIWPAMRQLAWVALVVGAALGAGWPHAAAAQDTPAAGTPTGTGQFWALSGRSPIEVSELLEVVTGHAQASLGYTAATREMAANLPAPPEDLQAQVNLARQTPEGLRLLQVGFKTFLSQPPHVWLYGLMVPEGGGEPEANADVGPLRELIDSRAQQREQAAGELKVGDLRAELITLSYIGQDRATALLKTLGYEVIEFTTSGDAVGKAKILEPSQPVDPKKLPIVVAMPADDSVDLVGGAEELGGAFGLKITPSLASRMPNLTSAAPMSELMVLYDPARPEQFSEVLERVQSVIDRPARQILIEAMVLEISETGLEQLGVEWELESPGGNFESLRTGRLPDFRAGTNEIPTVDVELSNIFGEFAVRVQALVREGEAEVLSRPSVLTIDGRQAAIRVGEEIPIATSFRGATGGDFIQLDFEYIPTGILLNIRPRMTAESEEVSLQIDGIVTAEVPGQDLIVRDNSGEELGRAPRISTRRVQTYSRVANNTPFIIGGLISRNNATQIDKVPVLGDIPVIKHLFRSTRIDTSRREVIIVLTPFVLPEEQIVGRNLPKDEDAFDSFGNKLFRDAYRIRAEDVFDLGFLTENRQLQRLQALADRVVRQRASLAGEYPYDRFSHGRIPGEHILVFRQMYEVIKRRALDQEITPSQIIFFVADPTSESGFRVSFLGRYMEQLARDTWLRQHGSLEEPAMPEDFFEAVPGKAIAMTYTLRRFSDDAGDILQQPVPELRLVDVADEQAWSRMLWELNQPDRDGRQRYTILLREQSDITRLKRSLLLKQTVQLNATEESLSLQNFSVGRLLLLPTVKDEKVHLVDSEVAKYFYLTEQYYPAMRKEMRRDIEALQYALESPAIEAILGENVRARGPLPWSPDD